MANVHGCTGKNVRWTNENRIAYLVDELLNILHRGEGAPLRLVDAQLIEHGRELTAVLGTVDVDRRCTQDWHRLAMELHSQVVWNLTTYRNNHTTW